MSLVFSLEGFRFTLVNSLGSERALWEWRTLSGEFFLPMTGHVDWSTLSGSPAWCLGIEDPDGRCQGSVPIQVIRSRVLPTHRILRVERFGSGVTPSAWGAALRALASVASRQPRVLRLHVELFALEQDRFERLNNLAREAGLLPSPTPRCYGTTALVDLQPSVAEVLASFHGTARRHIRGVEKHPVEVRIITEENLGPRMDTLLQETLARTGGAFEPRNWSAIIRFSRVRPDLSRIVGLFQTVAGDENTLLAYAWGCCHGDHVEYATAASTRATELKLPMAYPLAWDLMQWAREQGAMFFDFGGMTEGSHGSSDALGGISDFKRYFNGMTARVGEEWVLEPSPFASKAARIASRLANRLRQGARG